jgi:type II secretory pathway component PulF
MPNYSYQGLDKLGKQVAGEVSADDNHTALLRVKGLGVYPTDIKIARAGSGFAARTSTAQKGGKIRSSDVTIFSRQLANLVRGGLPLMRTFSALTEHTENAGLKAVLERMQEEIRGGKALWEALAGYPAIFSPLYVSMVKAGEASGQLSSVLNWLAGYLEKEDSQRNQVRSALAYPALLVTVGVLTITALVLFIVPKFVSMFQEFGQALPLPTVILVGISGFMVHWWWALFAGILGIVVGTKAYVRTASGRLMFDVLKLKLPLFGRLNLKSAISRFSRTTATLLQGGVTLFEAMNIARDVVGNEVLARGADFVRDGMREGQSFAGRLKDSGVFPPLLVHMAAVGEETGDLQGVLLTVSDTYDVEVEATLKSVISLLEPIIIVVIGSAVAFVILAMLLPVFEINMMG